MAFLDLRPGWVVLMGLLYYVNPLGAFWPFCAAMAFHELGHLLALRLCGVSVHRLRLELGGAVLETASMDYRREIFCAMAGPFFSLLATAGGRQFPRFAVLSLCLALFNLLPVPPLDGGRALRAFLLLHLRPERVRQLLLTLSALCLLVAAALSLWLIARGGGIWPAAAVCAATARVGDSVRQELRC